jgi:signal transduction histidine kinase
MIGRLNLSLAAWTAAVTIPLVVLAVQATLGIQAQKEAARAGVRKEAAAVSASQARLISEQLKAAIQLFPQFPDPPIPGRASPLDEILDGSDLKALKQLRDNPDAGISPEGLPRRALAALRIDHLDPDGQSAEELAGLLTAEAPSVLTLPALKRLQTRHPGFEMPGVWQLIDPLEELGFTHPDGGWIRLNDRTWWISPAGDRFVPPSALSTEALELPSYAAARFSSNNQPLTSSSEGEVLASTPVEFPSPLALDWILTSPEILSESSRQQTRWSMAFLGTLIIVSATGLFAILGMVTEERRMNGLKSQFVASVSHELRAPISSIRLMAENLESGRVESPAEFHRLICRESERLSYLIENVLDFARIEEGRRHYHFEETDLAVLARETIALMEPRAANSGHILKASLASVTATVDHPALQQAISNLLDNALKFSPASTTVSVSLTSNGSHWFLAISDEGTGIPESERERIFERFYRIGDELRRETQGSGIGLSIVRHIIAAHGGDVIVAGDPTTFTLTAPIHPPAESS